MQTYNHSDTRAGGARRSPDFARVAEAANFLTLSPSYDKLVSQIIEIVDHWDNTPRIYSGKQAVLNALVDVGVDNRGALDRMLGIVAEKRRMLPAVRKVDYQRNLMQARRQREYKALAAHELVEGPVRGKARDLFYKALRKRWSEAKGRHLDALVSAKGRELTYQERLDATAEFWAGVDRNLATAIRGRA